MLRRSGGPVFATPTLYDLDGDGRMEVIVGSWDSGVHIIRWDAASRQMGAQATQTVMATQPLRSTGRDDTIGTKQERVVVKEFVAPFITIPGTPQSRAIQHYRAHFENTWHPVPLVVHRQQLTGLIQSFLAGTRVDYWAEIADSGGAWRRVPAEGVWSYTVQADWRARIVRRLGRWLHR